MSQATTTDSLGELVFYVDEEGEDFVDDFTFYTGLDRENVVINRLEDALRDGATARSGERTDKPTTERRERTFSFSKRILVKNLLLTKANLTPPEDFWASLKRPQMNSQYSYLSQQLQNRPKAAESMHKLMSDGGLDDAARKDLQGIILKILNKAIRDGGLEYEEWAKNDDPNSPEAALIAAHPDPIKGPQWRTRVALEKAFPELITETKQPGRGLMCFSYAGRYLSVTFRKISKKSGYKAEESSNESYMFSFADYCKLIYREVFEMTHSTQRAQGMVVVTGSTKSGKSEIARGLIHLYLAGKTQDKRRHHLVTFEDPIERFYGDEDLEACYPWAVDVRAKSVPGAEVDYRDYTPREKKEDADLLQDALNDALRQTPALFFVGETRDKEEWKVLLDFAATGHLIVTTAHAGSLVEAMHKIFEAMKVETPADRSEIASKLLAVIHLRSDDLKLGTVVKAGKSDTQLTNVLFPTMWRRTPRGSAGLTSDGLASLLPFRPKSGGVKQSVSAVNANSKVADRANTDRALDGNVDAEGPVSSLGRRWFIQQLIDDETTAPKLKTTFGEKLMDLRLEAYGKARAWDLQGE